jgi:uncharacterized protein (TIGR00369 family)
LTSEVGAAPARVTTTPANTTTSAARDRTSAFVFEPHNCFACGSLNTHGLQLDLHLGEQRSWTSLVLDQRFEGWQGIAHGGIVCTLLDEVMAWALVAEDNWGVTARMQVEFRKPVPIGRPLRAEGWITRARRRVVETEAHVVDVEDGTTYAIGTGTYVAADAARKAELRERYGFRRLTATRAETDATDVTDATARTAPADMPGTVDDR